MVVSCVGVDRGVVEMSGQVTDQKVKAKRRMRRRCLRMEVKGKSVGVWC